MHIYISKGYFLRLPGKRGERVYKFICPRYCFLFKQSLPLEARKRKVGLEGRVDVRTTLLSLSTEMSFYLNTDRESCLVSFWYSNSGALLQIAIFLHLVCAARIMAQIFFLLPPLPPPLPPPPSSSGLPGFGLL